MKQAIVILSILASVIGVFVFFTGKDNFDTVLVESGISEKTVGLPATEVAEEFINWYDSYNRRKNQVYEHRFVHPQFKRKLERMWSDPELDYDPVLHGQDCICCIQDKAGKRCKGELMSESGSQAIVMMHGIGGWGKGLKVKLKKENNRWRIVDTYRD